MSRPVSLFLSYSHKDDALREELETHLAPLKRQGVVESWHDRRITPGDEWKQAIDGQLNEADIILLLVTPDFMASDYCYTIEMNRAMERHRSGEARVIPIIGRATDWKNVPISALQALPRDGKPVVKWADRDEAWLDIVQGIRLVAEAVSKQPAPPRATQPAAGPPQVPPVVPGASRAPAAAAPQAPTTASLRRLLDKLLVRDEDLEAFCLNYFPQVHGRLGSGMNRVAKVNLLFTYADRGDILKRLREEEDPRLAELERQLLRYD